MLGDRKKYMKLLKSHQKTFYDGSSSLSQSESGTRRRSAKSKRTNVAQSKINMNDSDSDNSIDRMQGMLEELQTKGKLKLGMGAINVVGGELGGAAPISQNDLLNVLNAHDEKKYDLVRNKYL